MKSHSTQSYEDSSQAIYWTYYMWHLNLAGELCH